LPAVTDSKDLLDFLLWRRSVPPRRLLAPGPSDEELSQIVAAGLRAPDHGSLRPWRLLLLDDRERLADAFAAAEVELRPTVAQERVHRARERAWAGPALLALAACIHRSHEIVPEHEQWIAIGTAVQQMLLAAEAMGYAGSLLSGEKVSTLALRHALNLGEAERLVGFLTFGTAAKVERPAPRVAPEAMLRRWP